jgi:hypothetical protein
MVYSAAVAALLRSWCCRQRAVLICRGPYAVYGVAGQTSVGDVNMG